MDAWVGSRAGAPGSPTIGKRDRLGKILGDSGRRIGGTLQAACQGRAATKAAYYVFSNPRVDEGDILAGHSVATRARFATTAVPVLILHDNTESSFTRDNPDAIGQLTLLETRHAAVTLSGLLGDPRSSLALTPGLCRWGSRPQVLNLQEV